MKENKNPTPPSTIIIVCHTVNLMFRLDWHFCPPIKSLPRIWDRQPLLFNGAKGIVKEMFQVNLAFVIDQW